MTNLKAISAVVILSAAIATPAFAKDHGRAYDRYRGAYNQMIEPSYAMPQTQAAGTSKTLASVEGTRQE